MNKESDFLPVTVSLRRGELALLDTAAKQVNVNRSEFVRETAVTAARLLLEPRSEEATE